VVGEVETKALEMGEVGRLLLQPETMKRHVVNKTAHDHSESVFFTGFLLKASFASAYT
jgi:hypothetical protein